jgi:hypothetical protein
MTEQMTRYLQMFDLEPGASLDEISTVYFSYVEDLAKNPTEEDEARIMELRRAYDILRRGYVPPKKKTAEAGLDGPSIARRLAIGLAALLVTLVWINWGEIKLKMTRYDPGAVLRIKSASEAFGTVVRFEKEHHFPAGSPGAAYEFRLDGKTATIWVSERTVVDGMTPVSN